MSSKDLPQERREYAILKFQQMISPVEEDAEALEASIHSAKKEMYADLDETNRLISEINRLAEEMGAPVRVPLLPDVEEHLIITDSLVDHTLGHIVKNAPVFPPLGPVEYVVSVLSGFLAFLIDSIFVGTPEVVKIYRGGERFDGSPLTAVLRKIGKTSDGEMVPILQWLSNICKVPYDISAASGVMHPNNHRLRSFSHDPFIGLFFAIADILCGTTTCIDHNGRLRVLVSPKDISPVEKFLAAFYYLGHIISDLCTARGIPVPGFCLTQFFVGSGGDSSLARIAERMYLDGYDLRHLSSAAVPVAVKNLLIDAYLHLSTPQLPPVISLAEKERRQLETKLKREKMRFVSSITATGGNLAKFLLPPNSGNPCALNLVQWFDFVRTSCNMAKAAARDRTVETVMVNRDILDRNWEILLSDSFQQAQQEE